MEGTTIEESRNVGMNDKIKNVELLWERKEGRCSGDENHRKIEAPYISRNSGEEKDCLLNWPKAVGSVSKFLWLSGASGEFPGLS